MKAPFSTAPGRTARSRLGDDLAADAMGEQGFNHVLPGSKALTFGMLGCDFHYSNCQNWLISQALRDEVVQAPIREVSPAKLVRAAQIGAEAGLRFAYADSAPGFKGNWENTHCPECHSVLIERLGYTVQRYRLTPDGKCPDCSETIPGLWHPGGAKDVPDGTFASRRPPRVMLS